jgi:transcriptional regulator with XRE-family HTH domain
MGVEREAVLLAFGARLSRCRREKGLTQEDLGSLAGLHRTYVGSVERGERNPTLTTIVALAEGLGCAVSELVKEPGGAAA